MARRRGSMEIQYFPQLTNPAAKGVPEYSRNKIPGRFERYYSKGDGTFRVVGLPGQGVIAVRGGEESLL